MKQICADIRQLQYVLSNFQNSPPPTHLYELAQHLLNLFDTDFNQRLEKRMTAIKSTVQTLLMRKEICLTKLYFPLDNPFRRRDVRECCLEATLSTDPTTHMIRLADTIFYGGYETAIYWKPFEDQIAWRCFSGESKWLYYVSDLFAPENLPPIHGEKENP